MKQNDTLKVIFGIIIFAFSLALAYFTADYFEHINFLDYWNALLIFGGAYVLMGIIVMRVLPVSLGFLFASDILLLHALANQYEGFTNIYKAVIVGVILAVLYAVAWLKFPDSPTATAPIRPPSPPVGL